MLQFALLAALAAAEDAPVAEPLPSAAPAETKAVEAAPAVVPEAQLTPVQPWGEPVGLGYHYAAGAAAAVIAVPASIYLGSWLGSLSNDLIGAAIPVLLSIGLIPPVAVTLATVLVGNWNSPGRYRWWPALLATTVINGASLALGASFGLSAGVIGRVIVYTLVQAVVQPAAAVGIERAWPKQQQPTVITLASDPVAPRTFVVPTSTWSF